MTTWLRWMEGGTLVPPSRGMHLGLMFLCSVLLPLTASAQNQSALRVTVRDETQAALIHAVVTLVDAAGVEKQVLVDEGGVAAFNSLAPGNYQVRVEAEGFQPFAGPFTMKRGNNTAI